MSEPEQHLEPAPGKTAFDYAVAIAKVGAIVFPFLGPGITLFDLVTAPARGKRLSDWCEQLRLHLNELSEKVDGLTPEALATNEAFISAFAQATTAAIKTHQQEKLAALRNAVLNVSVGRAPSEDLQSIFLNFIDSFAPIHLQVLAYRYSKQRPAGPVGAPEVSDQAVRDLRDRGLLRDTRSYAARDRDLPVGSLITEPWEATSLGEQFLAFIKAPEPKA